MTATSDPSIKTKVQHVDQGDSLVVASGGNLKVEAGGQLTDANGPVVHCLRTRLTIAQVNAGATLLPAIVGKGYRMVACDAIAVGGAAGAVTTVDVLGTLTTSRKLVSYAQASLTQSAVLKDGGTGAAVLADGASYTLNDANTAITANITGSSITTATNIDFILSYTIE